MNPLASQLDERLPLALALLRQTSGFSQDELARRSAVRSSSISDYERGKIVPGLTVLAKLLVAQDLPLEAIDRALIFVNEIERLSSAAKEKAPGRVWQAVLGREILTLQEEIEALAWDLGRVVMRCTRLLFFLLVSLCAESGRLGLGRALPTPEGEPTP